MAFTKKFRYGFAILSLFSLIVTFHSSLVFPCGLFEDGLFFFTSVLLLCNITRLLVKSTMNLIIVAILIDFTILGLGVFGLLYQFIMMLGTGFGSQGLQGSERFVVLMGLLMAVTAFFDLVRVWEIRKMTQ